MNMLAEILKGRRLILGSGSPRRSFFLRELGLDFEVRLKEVEESFPEELKASAISEYLAQLKASPLKETLQQNEILITADTIVWLEGNALGKPGNKREAKKMLKMLSGKRHKVISSIALTSCEKQRLISESTEVAFKNLTEDEINYYIDHFKPFDKAGAYGIQEWIGYIGITEIKGSYFNVMGFPVQKFYEAIKIF